MEESALNAATAHTLVAAICLANLPFAADGMAAANSPRAATNLLVNGSFDDLKDPLAGWVSDYTWADNSWYRENHKHVSVVPAEGGRKHVLRLSATRQMLWGDGQGVKVDSKPVPFEPGTSYKLSVYARTQAGTSNPGPNCRIYIEGYDWKPGIKPRDNPDLSELRKTYKQGSGNLLYFGKEKSGPFSNPAGTWSMGSCVFPGERLSEQAQKSLGRVKFICVHIVAIDGWDGDIFIDDVVLEKTGK